MSTNVRVTASALERPRSPRLYHCEFMPEHAAPRDVRSVVVLMHGYAEHCRRYDQLSIRLAQRGHAVCLLDARGHGRSQGQRGHVRGYEEYVDDLAAFAQHVRGRFGARPLVLLGHSNGGLIVVRALQRSLSGGAGPEPLAGARGAVLTGPLLGLRRDRRAAPDWAARVLSALAPRLPLPNGIRSQDLTADPALRAAHDADPLVHGVATPRWYWSMTQAARRALALAPELTLPLLVIQGEQDPIVDLASVQEFVARCGSTDKQLVLRRGELHEVLNEVRRIELFDLVVEWVERVCA